MSTETERHKIQQSRHRERGVALVVALLAIAVLTGIGFALMLSSTTEGLIHGNFRQSGLALYAARAGVEEARGRLGQDLGLNPPALPPLKICGLMVLPYPAYCNTTPDTKIPDVTTGLYILLNNTITPRASCTYLTFDCTDPDAATDGLDPSKIRYLPTVQTGTSIPYVWVKITLATQLKLNRNLVDPTQPAVDDTQIVYWRGKNLSLVVGNPPNPVYIMTALAIEPGGARRIVRELGSPGIIPPLPGGLVFDTPCPGTVTYPPPVSHPYMVSGEDTAGGADLHAVVVGCAATRDAIQNLIMDGNKCSPLGVYPAGCQAGPNHNSDYPGIGNNSCTPANNCSYPGSINGADIFYDPTLATNPDLGTCQAMQDLVSNVELNADYTYPAGTTNIPNPGDGSNANPALWRRVTNVIRGNATLGQADFGNPGAGIILIEGNLVLNGYPNYKGVILIIGTGSVQISGGGNGVVEGGIFLANTTTCPATLGSTSFDDSGGGNFQINYNSDATKPKGGNFPVQRISENY